MPQFPLAARVVEVIADMGEDRNPRYRCGSGCLVAGRTVLTAAHVVAGATTVLVRGPDKVAHEAAADPVFTGDEDGPDLALIEVIHGGIDVPAMPLAAVERSSPAGDPVERCRVIGYPEFMEREAADGGRVRETAEALGQVPVLSGLASGLLSVQVSNSPETLPPALVALGESPWSGMSGAPVIAEGCLLAVVTEHGPRAGPSAITATPLTALERDPAHPLWGRGVADPGAWWARLGVSSAKKLKRLPVASRQGTPAYLAMVKEIRQRTGMLTGRQDELAKLISFAAGNEGYRWLVGDAWAGKTSLLAEAVTTLQGDGDVVCYFLSRREADADSSRFLAAVVPQLACLLDEDPPAASLLQFRALWQKAAEQAEAERRYLLLAVDGLDEDLRPPGLPSVGALLPARAGGRVHVLVSSRPHPDLPADIPAGHPLRNVRQVPLEPFGGARELAVLARQEIDDLLRGEDAELAAEVLGTLTAAAGALTIGDLATLIADMAPVTAVHFRRVDRLVTENAARSLQPVGPAEHRSYQFAHSSLLEQAQTDDHLRILRHPDYRRRIDQWAEGWRVAGWPTPADGVNGTPPYLLDTYSSTLVQDPRRLAQLASDVGWVCAAIASAGVDRVLANLRRAAAANPADVAVAAVLKLVTGQAHNLRPSEPLGQPGYILRQLWIQAAELAEENLAEDIRSRLQSPPGLCPVLRWITPRARRALPVELGHHDSPARELAMLADGRLASVGLDGQVLVWDPARLGVGPVELGRHGSRVLAIAGLADGRLASVGRDRRVLVWDPARLGVGPVELGRHGGWVLAVAGLADGRMVGGGDDGRVLVWDPAHPGAGPALLGRHGSRVRAVAGLADGRVASAGYNGRVLVWDPARLDVGRANLGHHGDGVQAVAELADGRVASAGNDGRVLVWDPAHPRAGPALLGRHGSKVWAVAGLADGRVASAGNDGRVLVWDPARLGARLTELGQHGDGVQAVAVLADGRVIGGDVDGRVLVWDPACRGVGPADLGRHSSGMRALAELADGRVASVGRDEQVLLWNPDPACPDVGPVLLGRHSGGHAVVGLANGRVASAGYDGKVLVWDPGSIGCAPAVLGRHGNGVWAVAGLADGRVASLGWDRRLLVRDPANLGATPVELYRDGAWAVAGLADGRVATGSFDGRVLAWDPASPGAGPAELGRHGNIVRVLAGLADGRVVSGGDNRRVLVWDPASAGTPIVQLCCSVTALAAAPLASTRSDLVIVHEDTGFSLWSFTDAQSTATKRDAAVTVVGRNVSGNIGLDSAQLRSTLEQLSDAIKQLSDAVVEVHLTTRQKLTANLAIHDALKALQDHIVNADSIESNLKRVGEILSQANVEVEEGTPLWNSIATLAPLLDPLVGGRRIATGWFGIVLPKGVGTEHYDSSSC